MSAPPTGKAAPLPERAADPPVEESLSFKPRFDAAGLIPCVTVDAGSGDVLMVAWANSDALRLTLQTGFAHYWSRSRQAIWKKGETSGARQELVEVLVDCDQDTLLFRVNVTGRAGACHTGRTSCFYRSVPLGAGQIERDFKSDDAAA